MKIFRTRFVFLLFIFCCTFLKAQTPVQPSGSGTSADPYIIATLSNLYWVTQNSASWGKYFKQIADIDASSTSGWPGGGFSPIGLGSTHFTGSYDGNGHTITGLYINRSDQYIGMFAYNDVSSSVSKLGLVNVNITGNNITGGLVGCSNGNLTNCYTSGHVTGGGNAAGGLVGYSGNNITNCYSSCNVSGSATNLGGLIGIAGNYEVSFCYSVGTVTGSINVGGFVGITDEEGMCIIESNCFWNTETAGGTGCGIDGSGGFSALGKTTSQMKTLSTYAGWDFTNTWEIISGYYPRLKAVYDPTLPVELTSFSAIQKDNGVSLNWQTATELNNYGFEIERAVISSQVSVITSQLTVLSYGKIGFIDGAGNSNSPESYSFTDNNVKTGKYAYRLKQIDNDGKFKYSGTVEAAVNSLPGKIELEQNYPNPFNPSTVIKYQISEATHVTLKVYDMLGKEVVTLVNEFQNAGIYSSEFSIQNTKLSTGIYIAKLTAGKYAQSIKMSLVK